LLEKSIRSYNKKLAQKSPPINSVIVRLPGKNLLKMSEFKFLNIGFNNGVLREKIVAVISPDSASAKRLRDEARADHRLIDASQGRKTRSMLIMDSNHVILSSQRFSTLSGKIDPQSTEKERD
jgi:regulator of extracellular matrix RemA (YlzA/DUF370 family)